MGEMTGKISGSKQNAPEKLSGAFCLSILPVDVSRESPLMPVFLPVSEGRHLPGIPAVAIEGDQMPAGFSEQSLKTRFNDLPVNDLPEIFNVFWPGILLVEVVGMLPNIAGKQRRFPVAQRVARIRCLNDLQSARSVFHQPGPP